MISIDALPLQLELDDYDVFPCFVKKDPGVLKPPDDRAGWRITSLIPHETGWFVVFTRPKDDE